MRLPREPLSATRGRPLRVRAAAIGWALFLAPWLALVRWRLRRVGIRTNRYVLGLSDTGAMTEETVLRLARDLPEGVVELYFHPATASPSPTPLPMPAERHEAELQALLSPRVRRALEASGAVRSSFSELA
jgi:hypothetical protein